MVLSSYLTQKKKVTETTSMVWKQYPGIKH
jgi:hypothetical protein